MLEFRNVTRRFGDITALEDINFKLENGEFLLLTGPSGAGKTTILRLLIHEFPVSEGEIYLDETAVHQIKRSQIPSLRQQIGSVFQDFRLLPTQTVRENMELALAVKKIHQNEWNERVSHIASLVGLDERVDLFPNQLSGGELQRASIARALITNPALIFADEPTGNLDWETAEGIMTLLSKINEEGKTVIVTTHNRDIIDRHKGRVIELKKGKIVKDSTKKAKKHHEE